MRFKLTAVIGLAAVLVTVSAAAASAATNTVTVGSSGTLTSRILIKVPVTVVCDPLPDSFVASSVSISVQQANGKQISTATGFLSSITPAPSLLTCDGVTQNTVVVTATLDAGSGPFHGGAAIVIANFFYDTGLIFGGGSFQITNSESGISPFSKVSLHG